MHVYGERTSVHAHMNKQCPASLPSTLTQHRWYLVQPQPIVNSLYDKEWKKAVRAVHMADQQISSAKLSLGRQVTYGSFIPGFEAHTAHKYDNVLQKAVP